MTTTSSASFDAAAQAEGAREAATEGGSRANELAQEMLARIALAQHDADGARRIAAAASQTEPTFPLLPFVEARLLYDQGKYTDALPLFEQSVNRAAPGGRGPQSPQPDLIQIR